MNAIEIYENADRKLNKSEITLGEYERMIDPLRNVIPISEGVTNGDIIKAMFPNYKFSIDFGWVNINNVRSCSFCSVEFWNTPYKGSEG